MTTYNAMIGGVCYLEVEADSEDQARAKFAVMIDQRGGGLYRRWRDEGMRVAVQKYTKQPERGRILKNVFACVLAFLIAQTQNYIEIDGKRTYVESMTPQEIRESERVLKESEKQMAPKPAPKISEGVVVAVPHRAEPPEREVIYKYPERSGWPYYDRAIRIRIENRRPLDKEYFEATGPGTYKKTEVFKGTKTEESWKMEGGNLVKERKEIK